jgi:hypothetical protein
MLATVHDIGFPPALSKRRLLLGLRISILPACSQTSINIPIHHPIIFVLRNWGTVIGRSFPDGPEKWCDYQEDNIHTLKGQLSVLSTLQTLTDLIAFPPIF